jgi:uncharacterized protein YndB with AHSA1/START domain
MNPDQQVLAPVIQSVLVNLPLESAFHLFTRNATRWWPLRTHSVGGDEAVSCTLEGWVGGRFYEVGQDGSQSDWGKVLVWDPPHRLVCTFYPGRTPDVAGELEVAFHEVPGGTRVTLTHRGWERLGKQAQAEREGYARGWEVVLRKFVEAASEK